MAETTGISWADATLNFWIGCTKVSPACDNCYAETWGKRFGVEWGVSKPRRSTVSNLAKARAIERKGAALGQRQLVFSNSLSDIFDREVPIEWLRDAFDVMRATPGNVYLLLTKRPGLIVKRATEAGGLPSNAAIGCTVIDQSETREIVKLLDAKAALRPLFAFVSIEPMLGPVDLTHIELRPARGDHVAFNALTGSAYYRENDDGDLGADPSEYDTLDWVIVGGESGPRARPLHPQWVRTLRNDCASEDVPFHGKQNGEWAPGEIVCGSGATGVVQVAWAEDNGWTFGAENLAVGDGHVDDEPTVYRIGAARSGRNIDGVVHDARPQLAREAAHG